MTERSNRVERAETRPFHTSDLMRVGIFVKSFVAGSLASDTHMVGRGSIRSPLPRLWPRPPRFNEGTGRHRGRRGQSCLAMSGGVARYGAVGVDMDLICQCLGELGEGGLTSVLKSSSGHVLQGCGRIGFSAQVRHLDVSTLDALDAALQPRFARRVLSCRLWTARVAELCQYSLLPVLCRVSSCLPRTGLFASSPCNATICSIVSPQKQAFLPTLCLENTEPATRNNTTPHIATTYGTSQASNHLQDEA
jgi:hypothetical protein